MYENIMAILGWFLASIVMAMPLWAIVMQLIEEGKNWIDRWLEEHDEIEVEN